MVIDIKMCRFDNVPWGFRLVGGTDFECPLTVVKVTEGSIAEEAGLRAGDIIVRVNDTATSPLTHDETNKLIKSCGNVFYFGVHREIEEEEEKNKPLRFPVKESPSIPSASIKTEQQNGSEPELEPVPEHEHEWEHEEKHEHEDEHEVRHELDLQLEQKYENHLEAGKEIKRECTKSPQPNVSSNVEVKAEAEEPREECIHSIENRPCSVISETTEIKLVEEEIAAVMSGETEVLKDHNVLGIFPKPGVCMSSDVLRSLNEEAIKTKAEKDKENKKWSTFLQKPNRPIPKSKQQIEAERRAANAYRVKIVKSPISRERTPPPASFTSQNLAPEYAIKPVPEEKKPSEMERKKEENSCEAKEEAEVKVEQEAEKVEEEPIPADNELPDLESIKDNISNSNEPSDESVSNEIEKSDKEKEIPMNEQTENGMRACSPPSFCSSPTGDSSRPNEDLLEQTNTRDEIGKEMEMEKENCTNEKSEEELALERQLADVQKQLAALSSLPSTIQSTLDAVTKQLAELLPAFKLQQELQQLDQKATKAKVENKPREINLERIDEILDETNQVGVDLESVANSERDPENKHNDNVDGGTETKNTDNDLRNNEKCQGRNSARVENGSGSGSGRGTGTGAGGSGSDDVDGGNGDADDDINDMEVASFERKQKDSMKEKDNLIEIGNEAQNLKKQKKCDVIGELEEHLERKKNPKRSKRAFGPLTPSSERPLVLPGGRRWYRPKDAYNDEFIAETLSAQAELITGTTLGVNFMKYQKPERKIDLNRSEVYKIIHHLDRQPVRGIEVRPPVVPAEADIRKTISS